MPQQIDFQPEAPKIDFQASDSAEKPSRQPQPDKPAPQGMAAPGQHIGANPPSWFSRFTEPVLGPGSAFGAAQAKREGASNEDPFDKPLIDFEANDKYLTGPARVKGVTRGFQSILSGLTTPRNAELLVGLYGATALPYLGRMIQLGFSGIALWSAGQRSPLLKRQIQSGDTEGAFKTATEMGLTVAGAGLAAFHGLKPGERAPAPVQSREGAPPSPVMHAASEAARRIDEIAPEVPPPVQDHIDFQPAETEAPKAETKPVEPEPVEPENAPRATTKTPGTTFTVRTPNQTKARVRYSLSEADDLKTSFDEGYNQDYQPRNTDRKGSRQRVEQRKSDLDPEAMGHSRMAGDGAPITSQGMAVTRNHGLQALKELYREGRDKANEYREWAIENAGLAGVSPEDAAKLKHPVLHRELAEEWSPEEIAKFAQEANMSAVARMSDAEIAEQMANKLTGAAMEAFNPNEDGVPNPEFVRVLIADLPPEEQAQFFDKNGELSQAGVRMARNAVFARAYPNRGAIERMAEATDSNVRNITNGMLRAAAGVAKMQDGIDRGDLHPLSIAQEIGDAAQAIDELRSNKKSVADWLAQEHLEGRNPLTDRIVQIFADEARRPKVIADTLKNYTEGVEKAGNPKQSGMFAGEPPTREEVLNDAYESARRTAEEAKRGRARGPELFGPDAGSAGRGGQALGGAPPAAEGEALGFLGSQYAHAAWNRYVAPALAQAGLTIQKAGVQLAEVFAPRSLADKKGLDLAMAMKGTREEQLFKLEAVYTASKRMFAEMPQADQIDVMDRVKLGKAQATPELQALVDSWRAIEDRLYKQVQQFKPGAPYLDNHFRIFWKTIPSPAGTLPTGSAAPTGFRSLFARSRRPLRGTMGFLKKHTLNDVSEGIARGGVPVSYNPQVLFEMSVNDTLKFITAQRMFEAAKANRLIVFGRGGSPQIPDGFVRVGDAMFRKMVTTYFGNLVPGTSLVDVTGKTMAPSGEWFVEESFGRLLNNYLSRDEFRNRDHIVGTLGSAVLWAKNVQTAFELSFSPFHALFETSEAWSSDLSRAITRIVNQGIIQGDRAQLLKGLGELARSPLAPGTASRLGGDAIRYVSDPQQFLATARGAQFNRDFPDADRMISDLFLGGGKLTIHDDYRINTLQAFQGNVKAIRGGTAGAGDWMGAAARTFPAMNELLMKPLFELYIPRLKIGFFLKEYSQAIEQASFGGKAVDRAALSRQVWDRIENRFGEMNFDNLFWDRTLKSGLQMAFRSVTWWLGNLRAISGGVAGQAREIRAAIAEKRAPYLDPGFVWASVAVMTTSAVIANIVQVLSGQGPTKSLTDIIHPRIGGTDDRGHPNRINIVTYLRTYEALARNPIGSVKNALSSVIAHLPEISENRDFFGNYIADPDAPAYERWFDDAMYMAGTPFSTGSAKRAYEQGAGSGRTLELFLLTKAPGDVDFTDAERELSRRIQKRGFRLTPKEVAALQERRRLTRELRTGNPNAQRDLDRATDQGGITTRQRATAEQQGAMSPAELRRNYLEAGLKRLSIEDAIAVYSKATPEEKEFLRDEFEAKERLIDRLPEDSRERVRRAYLLALEHR